MPLIVETGAGLSTATSFLTVAAADTRIAGLLYGGAWDAREAEDKERWLNEATAILSRLRWKGVAVLATQALAFPRNNLVSVDGFVLAGNSLPVFLLDATARLALFVSEQTATPYGSTGLMPGTEITIGPITLTPAAATSVLGADVRALITHYLIASNGLELVRC